MRMIWFNKQEWQDFWVVAFVFAFILSFNQWGADTFSFGVGIKNLVAAFLVVTLSLFVHHFGQRWWGAKEGVQAEQRVWWYGLIIGLIVVIFSNGVVKIFAATALYAHHVKTARLGHWMYETRTSTIGQIVFMGPLFNILLATIAFAIKSWIAPESMFIDNVIMFNAAFALFSMIPIPPLDGSRVFFDSIPFYVFACGSIVGYVVLSQLLQVYSIVLSLLIGAAFWLIFIIFERGVWK